MAGAVVSARSIWRVDGHPHVLEAWHTWVGNSNDKGVLRIPGMICNTVEHGDQMPQHNHALSGRRNRRTRKEGWRAAIAVAVRSVQ